MELDLFTTLGTAAESTQEKPLIYFTAALGNGRRSGATGLR
jgi:hypothetical protein